MERKIYRNEQKRKDMIILGIIITLWAVFLAPDLDFRK